MCLEMKRVLHCQLCHVSFTQCSSMKDLLLIGDNNLRKCLSFALAAALVAISVKGVRGVEVASSSGVAFKI